MQKIADNDFHAFGIKGRYFILDVERSLLYSCAPEVYQEITGDAAASGSMEKLPFFERWILKNELRNLRRKIKPLSEEKAYT